VPMHKLSYNLLSASNRGVEQEIETIARAGYPAVGIHRSKLEPLGVEAMGALVRNAGLKVSCYGTGGYFLEEGMWAQRIEETKRRIEITAQLGADCLVILTGPRGDRTLAEAEHLLFEALDAVLPAAQDHGVRLGLEPVTHVAQHITFLHLLSDALHLIERVDSPYLGLVVDVWYHWWQRDFADCIRRAGDRLLIVQLADQSAPGFSMMDRAPLGEGVIPLEESLHAVDAAGFAGYYDVEIFSTKLTDEQKDGLVSGSKAVFDRVWS
jgi:sugar phosphate isomerase/epimerase